MEVALRCLCTVFLVLSLVCESVTGKYCYNTFSGNRYYCEDDHDCCQIDECCYTYYVYQLWWFWFIWFIIFSLIACCIIAMRRRRNRLHFIRVAQPAYGTTTAHPHRPVPTSIRRMDPVPRSIHPPYTCTQPQKPPPYQ